MYQLNSLRHGLRLITYVLHYEFIDEISLKSVRLVQRGQKFAGTPWFYSNVSFGRRGFSRHQSIESSVSHVKRHSLPVVSSELFLATIRMAWSLGSAKSLRHTLGLLIPAVLLFMSSTPCSPLQPILHLHCPQTEFERYVAGPNASCYSFCLMNP
jgi:hypothetical protein